MARRGQAPVILVREGDGVGPEVIRTAMSVLDAATKAEGGIAWKPLEPELRLEPAPGLRVWSGPAAGARRTSGLDTYLATILPGPAASPLFVEASEGPGCAVELEPGSQEAGAVLETLNKQLRAVAYPLRFGSPQRVRAYAISMRGAVPPSFETGLSIELTSRTGSVRFFQAAFQRALEQGHRLVTVVTDELATPEASEVFLEGAIRAAATTKGAYTWRDRERDHHRASPEVAERGWAEALDHGVRVDRKSLRAASEALARDPLSLGVVCAPGAEGWLLAHVLGPFMEAAVIREDPSNDVVWAGTLHGTAPRHAGRGTADPRGAILAGAELLGRSGLPLARERVLAALRAVPLGVRGCAAVAEACVRALPGGRR